MDELTAKKLLTSADSAAAKRMAVAVAAELDGLTAQLWAFGAAEGARRALAIVAQMGAELALGAAQLYEANRWYAGAALVRQLIEAEYLLFLFATDDNEPEIWLHASEAEAKRAFSPSQMRERSRGRFRVGEYQTHCRIGGHPRLAGHILLKEHITPISASPPKLFDPAIQWVDLAQHLERFSTHYMAAVVKHSPINVYPDRFAKLAQLASDWRAADFDPDISHI
ncbi:MAG: hypothetical protein QOH39_1605 [Verrucomicrobiota bacterium]|jgi:hypothetical protein